MGSLDVTIGSLLCIVGIPFGFYLLYFMDSIINDISSVGKYTKEEIDKKFAWLVANHYKSNGRNGSFTFTSPQSGHGTIWMWKSNGRCDVWDSSGDGIIRPSARVDGHGFDRFKRYVVKAYDDGLKHDARRKSENEHYSNRIDEFADIGRST